ncbi:MAG: hypothetical protein QOJ29_824 [Thermoleophilaceae bacterium]|jgi:hypothetical protein|nr:hypothetical protein [Thermoleophilaceae bacterium]
MNVEQMLRNAGGELAWPATPDLVDPVSARIAPRPARRRIHVRRPLAIALAALLLMAATAAAIPGIREPVLDWLGLRSVHVERVPQPLPEPPGNGLGLGRHTTLAAAVNRIEFKPVIPTGLGQATVYYDDFPPGGQLALVYRNGQMLLTEVQGRLDRQYLFKFIQPGTGVQALTINGQRALWFSAIHQYAYADRDGQLRTDSVRTAGRVLLWRRDDLLLRLEGARSKAEALRIADSLRAAP